MLRAPSSILYPALVALTTVAMAAPAGALRLIGDLPDPIGVEGTVQSTTGSIGATVVPSDPVLVEYGLFYDDDGCCQDRIESLLLRLPGINFIGGYISTTLVDDGGDPALTDVLRFEGDGSLSGTPAAQLGVLTMGASLVLELRETGVGGAPPGLVQDGIVPRDAHALSNATGTGLLTLTSSGASMSFSFGQLAAVPEPGLGLLLAAPLGLAFARAARGRGARARR